jgi:hypothetical protein
MSLAGITKIRQIGRSHPRMDGTACLPTLEELKNHVHNKLCENDHLDPTQTPLRENLITRRGRPCGLFFQVQGPRLLKNFAVWAGEENRILFYNCSGERVAETRLSESPDAKKLGAN